MLLVETELRQSPIHGIGLFATKRILKGDKVWRFNPIIDQRFSIPMVAGKQIPEMALKAIWNYCYINPDKPSVLVICGDDARFMNFGEPANTKVGRLSSFGEYDLEACRDISPGEEITVPLDSDADAQRKIGTLRLNRSEIPTIKATGRTITQKDIEESEA